MPAVLYWTVRPQPAVPGKWEIDYDWPTGTPPSFTTIAWRLVHLANGNWIYWEHAFGEGGYTFRDLVIPGSADAASRYWEDSRAEITTWLDRATDGEPHQMRPSHLGPPRRVLDTVLTLADEQTHHGAEIGTLRDLYRSRAGRPV